MDNQVEVKVTAAPEKKKTSGIVVGIILALIFALGFLLTFIGDIIDSKYYINSFKWAFENGFDFFQRVWAVMDVVFVFLHSLFVVLLIAYTGLGAIRKGNKIKALFIAAFVIGLLCRLISAFMAGKNLISEFEWISQAVLYGNDTTAIFIFVATIVFLCVEIFWVAACLFAIISAFIKKNKPSLILGIVASAFIVLSGIAYAVNRLIWIIGPNMSLSNWAFVYILAEMVVGLGTIGTLILYRPVKK